MNDFDDRSAVVIADPSGTIQHFNADAELLFGHPAGEAVGASLDLIVPPDFQQAHWAGYYRAMDAAHADLDGTPLHLPVTCRDGQIRVFPGVFSVLRDPYGHALGAVATYAPARDDAEPFTPVATEPAPAQRVGPGAG
ncbi:PAS domain S-box protein [Saccharopolyspora rhizosphaerae]|uniref:PAS domain S-box protein n=1 Tax=Saccharopolyspora rhizosphaerae TaxID=2492662 RepID=A0A426K513_9PSEU|nr:PAS domain-containing protein [Saccharopolyspora rhizosphaerae]RRO20493.1 PAS domain S-box protein [Saccharopolyspora rhizosphaerae]